MSEPPDLFDRSNPDGVFATLRKLEDVLQLPTGFCEGLFREDDWSFIIKLHALCETALTELLVRHTRTEKLRDAFAELEMSRAGTGKIAFAEAFGILDKEDRRYLRALSEIRNRLVHRVQNVSFTLTNYVSGLDSNQRAKFIKAMAHLDEDTEEVGTHILAEPKSGIWIAGLFVVAMMMQRIEQADLIKQVDENVKKAAARLVELTPLMRGFMEYQRFNELE